MDGGFQSVTNPCRVSTPVACSFLSVAALAPCLRPPFAVDHAASENGRCSSVRSPTVALDISRSRLNLETIQSMPSELDSTSDTPGSLPGCRVAETYHLSVRRCCRRLPVWDCVKSICKIRPHGGGRDKFEELAGRLVRLEPRRNGAIFYKGRRDGCWVLRR
jgi:hypothetical protein